MKKIYSLISLPALLMVSSCSDKNEPMVPQTVPGEDVVFQASLPMNTRTSYGPLGTSSRPVYWTNGDLIQVASPQCANGFNNATYQVEVTSGSEVQNYADKLVHHDPTGVRWGTADPSEYRFFAMYPQCPMTINGSDMEAAVYFDPVQSSTMVKDGTKWTPSSYDMENNIMYAQPISNGDGTVKPQVTTDSEGNTVANLQFNPFSTVLHLNFAGWSTDNTAATEGFTVFSVTLKSPATTPIAGNFPLKLHSDGSLPVIGDAVASTSSSSIKLSLNQGNNMNGFTPSADETFECDFFMAPRANNANGVMNIGTGWSLEIETSAGNWSFDLGQATTAGSSLGLEPGQIHVLNIPELKIENGWVYNPDSWLAEINDPVYFTEVSLPGAWYAYDGMNTKRGIWPVIYGGNEGYQVEGTTVQDLFNAGIRAFQIESRMGYQSAAPGGVNYSYPVISGTGRNQSGSYVSAITVSTFVDALVNVFPETSSEFIVLCINYTDGTSAGTSNEYKARWLSELTSMLSKYGSRIYGESITPQTTISKLRGKIVVLINVDSEAENQNMTSWPNALLAYTNQSWSSSTMNSSMISPMTWASWPGIVDNIEIETVGQNPDNMYLNYTLANRTWNKTGTQPSGMPSLSNRKSAIESLISNSDKVYASKTHNAWYYIGAGGTYAATTGGDSDDNGPQNVARDLNPFLITQINSKIDQGKASPMGLVFINQCTNATYNGPEIVEAIIRMNRRFKLLEIGGTTPSNPGTQTDAPVKSVSSTHSSGFSVDKNGWVAF